MQVSSQYYFLQLLLDIRCPQHQRVRFVYLSLVTARSVGNRIAAPPRMVRHPSLGHYQPSTKNVTSSLLGYTFHRTKQNIKIGSLNHDSFNKDKTFIQWTCILTGGRSESASLSTRGFCNHSGCLFSSYATRHRCIQRTIHECTITTPAEQVKNLIGKTNSVNVRLGARLLTSHSWGTPPRTITLCVGIGYGGSICMFDNR